MASLVSILGEDWSPPPPRLIDPPELQLYKAIQDAGMDPPDEIHLDGVLRRFKSGTNGSGGHGDKTGWYVAFSDGVPAGRFGCWRSGIEATFRADIGRQITPSEEMAHARRMSEAKAKRDEDRKKAQEITADTVERIWIDCTAASPDHPYLQRKGVKPHGARVTGDGRLVVPLYNQDGELSSLQYISHDGSKLYHSGGATGKCMWSIGDLTNANRIYIAEGFATAATIHETTDKPCAVAYSASNLVHLTEFLRATYKDVQLVIVADNDASGVGQKYADQAAAKYGAKVIMPPTNGDANDYLTSGNDLSALLEPVGGIMEKMRAVFASDLSTEYNPPDELIEGLLVCGSMSVLYGDSNSGKTFLALAMAAAIAEGTDFFGRKTDPGVVVYLATESPASVIRRIQALRSHLNFSLTNLLIVQCPINFYQGDGDAQDVIELVQEVTKNRDKPVRLIIGDTLARMSAGANENSGEDMGPIMARFDRVAHATNAALLAIHHNGKNAAAGARGWSGIRAHIDTEIEITSDEVTRCATITKQRELGGKGEEIFFRLEVVSLGVSKFGSPASTCVAVPDLAAKQSPGKKKDPIKDAQDLFNRAWFSGGAEIRGDQPYIRKDALIALIQESGVSHGTAKNKAEPGFKGGPAFILINNGKIIKSDKGYLLVDSVLSSQWVLNRTK